MTTTIITTIVLTALFDWGFGWLISYNKKKQEKKDNDVFLFKLEQILEDKTIEE